MTNKDNTKASKRLQNLMMLSIVQPVLGVTKDDKKPLLFATYMILRNGVEMGSHTTKLRSCKWMLTAFAYLLDTARVNANTVFGKAKIHLSAWDFGKQLSRQFVVSYVKKILVLSKMRLVSREPPKSNESLFQTTSEMSILSK